MKKSELDLTNLINSVNSLKECYTDFCAEQNSKMQKYIKDSCIKRFEYTYETAKKIMNKFLKKEYDKSEKDLTINNIFREMYAIGIIENFENWTEYRVRRNTTLHEYDENITYPTINLIPDFIKDIEILIKNLEKTLIND